MAKTYRKIARLEYYLLYKLRKRCFRANARKLKKKKDNENEFSKQFSISIDDVLDVFKDLTVNKSRYTSIFQNITLSYLRELHESYGVCITLYCYFSTKDFDLTQVPGNYAAEFKQNADWLKFGFHARNFRYDPAVPYDYKESNYENAKNDYEVFMNELTRICGGEDNINRIIRLEGFRGSKEAIRGMRDAELLPIKGLLIADDDRRSYQLTDEQIKECTKTGRIYFDGLVYIKTTKRIDNIWKSSDIDKTMFREGHECVFTHEWMLGDRRIKYYTEKIFLVALKKGYQSVEN